MKIVLIGEKLEHRSFNGANKALPVLASVLDRRGYKNVVQMDLERQDLTIDDVLQECKNSQLICIVGGLATQWSRIDEHAKMIYDSLDKEVPIIVGGYAAKGVKDIALNTPWITAYFNGEGEEGIAEIVRIVSNGTFNEKMGSVKGLCFADKEGTFNESIAPRAKNLNGIDQNHNLVHIPLVHNMDMFKDKRGNQLKTAQLYTQRGCPYSCAFCNKSPEGNEVVHVGEEWFKKMVKNLKDNDFQAVYLDDDTVTVNQERFRKKMEILYKYGLKVGLNTRIDIEAERIRNNINNIEFAKDHGAVYQFFGVEHTDPGALKAIGKFNGTEEGQWRKAKQYKEDVRLVFQKMASIGIQSSYFLITGLPKEENGVYRPTTLEEDKEAIKFAIEECNPDYLNLNILRFMPGTIAADMPNSEQSKNPFTCVRPSKDKPINSAHFLPRVAKKLGYEEQEYHGIYRCFESLTANQPISSSITPKRAYETIKYTIDLINKEIDKGRKAIELFTDKEILDRGLIKRDEKTRKYEISKLERFRGI